MSGLVERSAESRRLRAAVDHARAGHGRMVIVEGPAGIGKSALLSAAAEGAARRGVELLAARAEEMTRDVPFGVARQLLLPLATSRGAARLVPAGGWPAKPILEAGGGAHADACAAAAALVEVVAAASAIRPLFLTIDDAQWLDALSLRWLEHLAPALRRLRASVVLARRTGEGLSLGDLRLSPGSDVLAPAPLSERGTTALIRQVAGRPTTSFAAAAREATGGNPLLVCELARELVRRRLAPDDEAAARLPQLAPKSLAVWVEARLERVGQQARALAEAVAVLGHDVQIRHAATVAELDVDAAAAAAAQLVRAGILDDSDRLRPTHPLIGAAVAGALPAPERARLNRAAAAALAAEGDLESAGEHLLRGTRAADPVAVGVLVGAAELAAAHGAPRHAARLLQRALEEPPAPAERARIILLGARALTVAGAAEEAEGAAREAVAAAGDEEERVAALRALALALGHAGRLADACDMLLAERQSVDDPRLRLELDGPLLGLSYAQGAPVELPEDIHASAALPGTTRAERAVLAPLARVWAMTGRSARECVPLAARALAVEVDDEPLDAAAWPDGAFVLFAAEELERLNAACELALEAARRRGAVMDFMFAGDMRAASALLGGDLETAEDHARAAYEAASAAGLLAVVPLPAVRLSRVLLATGRTTDAAAVLDPVPPQPPGILFSSALDFARAELAAAEGRSQDAVELLESVGRVETSCGIRCAVVQPWRSELARVLPTHRRADAQRLAEEEFELAAAWGVPGATGVALAARGCIAGRPGRVGDLEEAVRLLARSPRRLDLARASLDLGSALRAAGRRREAADRLRGAADLAHACRARPLAERALVELRALGSRPRRPAQTGPDALTAMEERVVRLAARGMTNGEIAQTLFVTRGNVEKHLTRAYAKLGVSSRRQLPGALAETTEITA